MANTSSAKKAVRTIARRTDRNKAIRTGLKTIVRKVAAGVKTKDVSAAVLNEAKSTLDKAVGKGVIHKNKANRLKSRLAKKAAAVAAAKK